MSIFRNLSFLILVPIKFKFRAWHVNHIPSAFTPPPTRTSYADERFELVYLFGEGYPFEAPSVTFKGKLFVATRTPLFLTPVHQCPLEL